MNNWIYVVLSCLEVVWAITCPGLGDFNSQRAFANFPDPTCPGDYSLELEFTMYSTGTAMASKFDRHIIPSNYNPNWKTLFVVHGWLNDGNTSWMKDIKNRLLEKFDANCVLVSWGGFGGSWNFLYGEAASTTRTVGAELAQVMMNLVRVGHGYPSNMHCAGHSLGAHVCGHFGRWAAERGMKPARCTGMDPGGLMFSDGIDRSVGIYTDCCDLVDIIHTDWIMGSTPKPSEPSLTFGHQDYYVNGGHDQPGVMTFIGSHARAHSYFRESIGNDCFIARSMCTASNDIPASCSPCGRDCGLMGYGASLKNSNGIYWLTTNAKAPYCKG